MDDVLGGGFGGVGGLIKFVVDCKQKMIPFASHFQSFLEPSASVAEEIDQQVRKRLKSRRSK